MANDAFTRRSFTGAIAAAVGATLVDRSLGKSAAEAAPPAPEPGPVHLSANENPYGPSDPALRAIAESARAGHRYPDEAATRVRKAIASHHGVADDQIVLGCGSSQILQMADAAFLGPGKRVIAAEPTFEAVLAYAAVMHADPVKVAQTKDFLHDLDAMAAACDATTGLVYLCNPNNPTGTIVAHGAVEAFVSRIPRSTAVLVDEAYHHFVEDPSYRSAVELIGRSPNLVVARTFSKIYGLAGMRLGYAVASRDTARRLEEFASWDNLNAAVLSAALASLSDPSLLPERRRTLNGTRRWLCDELERDRRRYIPSHANFVMIDVRGDVKPVIDAFRARGIEVGRKFPSMPNWLRITVGKPDEMRAFLSGLRAIVPASAKAA